MGKAIEKINPGRQRARFSKIEIKGTRLALISNEA